jgi:hypothetical protein
MQTVNLIKIKELDLAEIFQSLDIKFAYVNKNMEEVTAPAKCRDFLGDCIYSRRTGNKVGIYGFYYDYANAPFDDCRFSLRFPNDASMQYFLDNIQYLHDREAKAGVALSEVFGTQHPRTLVIQGDNHWVDSIWKVSLYTFYLKLISYKSIKHLSSPEDSYIKLLTDDVESVMLSKVTGPQDILPTNTGDAHNFMGFCSIIKGKKYGNATLQTHNQVFG